MSNVRQLRNAATRRITTMFQGFFGDAKHNHYKDFGYPDVVNFDMLYQMYRRNGIAAAAIDKTALKTWQDNPFLQEKQRDGSEGSSSKETPLELEIRNRFDDLRVWSRMAETDRRSMVGQYSALILRLGDGLEFSNPVGRVGGGLLGLVEVIPAWEGQLSVSEWETKQADENYGQPKMFQFNEAQVQAQSSQSGAARSFQVHPDRVIIWSRDGTLDCKSLLEPGYNDLIDMEKIKGAGGEGFWKNAKSAPVLELTPEAKIDEIASMMGVSVEEVYDKMNKQVQDWNKGFDELLMIQGMQAKSLSVNLPSPEHFFAIALQSFAASVMMPVKILVGSQSGERASTEDANEWSQSNMSRRVNTIKPNIMTFVNRLERFGVLPERDWHLDYSDLTEASMSEKIDRVVKMADTNQKMKDDGDIIFTGDEMRAVAGYEPLVINTQLNDDDDEFTQPPVSKAKTSEAEQ